jgi:hypothetical protein
VALAAWRELSEDERRRWAREVAEFVKVDRERRVIAAEGLCPECRCHFSVTLSDDDFVGEQLRGPWRLDWRGDLRFPMVCTCNGAHRGRPAHLLTGCGAGGRIVDSLV